MPRLIFANQLRGLAVLCVMLTHLVGVFWIERGLTSAATASPVLLDDPPAALLALFTHRYLNFGPLGLAIFFLISGFVIPFSLAGHSRASFMLARLLRIYPTYVVALLFQVGIVTAAASYWAVPSPLSVAAVVANALLVQSVAGTPAIDFVSWSLFVELKFYVLMMLLAPLIRRGSVAALFVLAGALFVGNLLLPGTRLPITTGSDTVFLVFMLVGVLFNFHWRGLIGLPGFAAAVVAMLALFLACWWHSVLQFQFWVIPANYFYALAAFGTAYAFRARFCPVGVLDLLARISFDLYVLHFLLGISLLKLLMLRFGLGYLPALGTTLLVLLALAWLLHATLEARMIAMGRRLAQPVRAVLPGISSVLTSTPSPNPG